MKNYLTDENIKLLKKYLPNNYIGLINAELKAKELSYSQSYISKVINGVEGFFNIEIINTALKLAIKNKEKVEETNSSFEELRK